MNITKLESILSYKALCNVIAILGGIFAVVSALAPDTISGLYDMTSKATESDNWVNAGRTSWIATGSVAFLASWARFVEEIYAQKIKYIHKKIKYMHYKNKFMQENKYMH